MDGLAAVLAAAPVADLAVNADALTPAVPTEVTPASVDTDLRAAALLAVGALPLVHTDAAAAALFALVALPLVHADAAAAALLALGAPPLMHADAAATALLRTVRVEWTRGGARSGDGRKAHTLHWERMRSWGQMLTPPQSRQICFCLPCLQRHFSDMLPRHTRYSYGPLPHLPARMRYIFQSTRFSLSAGALGTRFTRNPRFTFFPAPPRPPTTAAPAPPPPAPPSSCTFLPPPRGFPRFTAEKRGMVNVIATSPCFDCHPSHSLRIKPWNRRSFFAGRLPAISPEIVIPRGRR